MSHRKNWEWFGNAGHFICGQWCRFHLCTKVGPWLVSTVGEYVPGERTREILARSRGIKLEGHGNARLQDWLKKNGFEKLGVGPGIYETIVFRAGKPCNAPNCKCRMPIPDDWTELACKHHTSAGEATKGHYNLCKKWARKPKGWKP